MSCISCRFRVTISSLRIRVTRSQIVVSDRFCDFVTYARYLRGKQGQRARAQLKTLRRGKGGFVLRNSLEDTIYEDLYFIFIISFFIQITLTSFISQYYADKQRDSLSIFSASSASRNWKIRLFLFPLDGVSGCCPEGRDVKVFQSIIYITSRHFATVFCIVSHTIVQWIVEDLCVYLIFFQSFQTYTNTSLS